MHICKEIIDYRLYINVIIYGAMLILKIKKLATGVCRMFWGPKSHYTICIYLRKYYKMNYKYIDAAFLNDPKIPLHFQELT